MTDEDQPQARQRQILHIELGDEDMDFTEDDLQDIVDEFRSYNLED